MTTTTGTQRTRLPVTRLIRTGGSPAYLLRIWSVNGWMSYTFENIDPSAFALEPSVETVRTVILDDRGNTVAVLIGSTQYTITEATQA